MNYFEEVLAKLKNTKPSHIVEGAFRLNKEEIVNLVKKQLDEGIDSGNNIIGVYSVATESINPSKVAGTPYTLEDTGFFRDSFIGVVDSTGIFIKADGSTGKEEDIIPKYGFEIIGFTAESVDQVPGIILPDVIKATLSLLRNE